MHKELIPGWMFEGDWAEKSLDSITKRIGRQITDDELQEVAQLWDWNYDDGDCVIMILAGETAFAYDSRVSGGNDYE